MRYWFVFMVPTVVFVISCLCCEKRKTCQIKPEEEMFKELFQHPWFQYDPRPSFDSEGAYINSEWPSVPMEHLFKVPPTSRANAVTLLKYHPFLKLELDEAKALLGTELIIPTGYSPYLVRAFSNMYPRKSFFSITQRERTIVIGISVIPEDYDKLRELPLILLLENPPDALYHECHGVG